MIWTIRWAHTLIELEDWDSLDLPGAQLHVLLGLLCSLLVHLVCSWDIFCYVTSFVNNLDMAKICSQQTRFFPAVTQGKVEPIAVHNGVLESLCFPYNFSSSSAVISGFFFLWPSPDAFNLFISASKNLSNLVNEGCWKRRCLATTSSNLTQYTRAIQKGSNSRSPFSLQERRRIDVSLVAHCSVPLMVE